MSSPAQCALRHVKRIGRARRIAPLLPRGAPRVHSKSGRYRPRDPGPAAAAHGAQTQPSPAQIGAAGSDLLDCPPPLLVRWTEALIIVKPETVVSWHRAGFRLYWRWRSRPSGGRAKIAEQVRVLIRRLTEENPDWGAPKIHGELQKLGLVVSERTVARYLRRIRRRRDPGKQWLAFLQNHREAIVALDFFTVPTVNFQLLYCFFVYRAHPS